MKNFGPALAVAYCLKSNSYHVAINHFNGNLPKEMDSRIEARINQMPEGVLELYKNLTKGAGSHAEIYAANEALATDTDLKDLTIFVNNINSKSSDLLKELRPFKTCSHCEYILENFNIISNAESKWQPKQVHKNNKQLLKGA
ncbi:YwqJ-related putative deaminase [Bacillus thuringiensis]